MNGVIMKIAKDDKERFIRHITKTDSGCWIYGKGRLNVYGIFRTKNGESIGAHRFSYMIYHGEIPWDKQINHKCDVPRCVNPDHIYAGTPKDNMRDMHRRNRNRQPVGSMHPRAKLSEEDVITIRRLYSTGEYIQSEIAEMFNVSTSRIFLIVNRKAWKHV